MHTLNEPSSLLAFAVMPVIANIRQKYLKKNISKLWHVFNPPQNGRQLTTIHHESTTTSPQKHHTKNAHFPKPPSKHP
jgi:hypothetical protein